MSSYDLLIFHYAAAVSYTHLDVYKRQAFVTILAAGIITPAMPYLLSFAAGAMIYVVVEELIPEMSQGRHSNIGVIAFAIGFGIMMMLDAVSYTHLAYSDES